MKKYNFHPYLLSLLLLSVSLPIGFYLTHLWAKGDDTVQNENDSLPQPTGQNTYQSFLPNVSRQKDATDFQLFFPLLLGSPPPLKSTAYRIGYGNAVHEPSVYPNVATLRAGWFTNWRTSVTPTRPGNAEYVQMIRVHQKLSCGSWFAWNREACPYAVPNDYVFKPSVQVIQQAARANPGSIWLIGNEMDRVDFACGDGCSDGQDEMVPETYARAYHDLYQVVKGADPLAQVAIGGLIQPTPLRLQWLSIVWDSYRTLYGSDMPIDILNIHNFILQEDKFNYGAAVPPGLPGDPTQGLYIGDDFSHIDHDVFDQQIRAMRQWMKDRGLQQRPLVITEYGVLYSHTVTQGDRTLNFSDPILVHDFMLWTFDYYLTTQDCSLGYVADQCRLVQRWLWFSLDHAYTDANGDMKGYFNPYTSLFNSNTKAIFPAGELFRNYVDEKFEELSQGWVN